MNAVPTPEEFLRQTEPDEDEGDEAVLPGVDPLTSIASSLSTAVALLLKHDTANEADAEADRRYLELDQAYADLEDKHRELFALLADVEKIVAPSTSKLANSVREAIARWRNPEVPAEEQPSPSVEDYARSTAAAVGLPEWPANDADVEEWRDYARTVRGLTPQGESSIDQMNRSQIRTLLGIPQVEGA
jgi:hypothetical protein